MRASSRIWSEGNRLRKAVVTTVEFLESVLHGWAVGRAFVISSSFATSWAFLSGIPQGPSLLIGLCTGAMVGSVVSRLYVGSVRWRNWLMWAVAAAVMVATFVVSISR